MAEYTITDLPRELTEAEAYRMTEVCRDTFLQFEFEKAQPAHVCLKVHGGKAISTPDLDDNGKAIKHPLTGKPTFTNTLEFAPTCHDCGRGLVRPRGHDTATWFCGNARQHLSAGGPDSAIECGETR